MGRLSAPFCRVVGCQLGWGVMVRLYVRAANNKGYKPVGWVCREGHVSWDKK